MRGNYILGCGDGLRKWVISTNLTAAALIVPSVICMGLPNGRDVNCVEKASKMFRLTLNLSTQDSI